MCLIVDANVASLVFRAEPHEDFEPIWTAIQQGNARAVHGGKLTEEYMQIASIIPLLMELQRQGKMRRVPDEEVNAETATFPQIALRSDDPHILALAKVANVRLMCSHDVNLHNDFTNPDLLNPAGSIYPDHP